MLIRHGSIGGGLPQRATVYLAPALVLVLVLAISAGVVLVW